MSCREITDRELQGAAGFIAAVVATLVAIFAAIGGTIKWRRSRRERRERQESERKEHKRQLEVQRSLEPRCRRITSFGDEDLDAAIDLHHTQFPHVRLTGPRNDIPRWIAEYEQQVLAGEEIEWDEHLIIAKRQEKVVGYLYASFHTPTRFVFISYFGTDDSAKSYEANISFRLIECLFEHIAAADVAPYGSGPEKFRAVVAELDLEHKTSDGLRKVNNLSYKFGKISKRLHYPAFVIDGFEYYQPLIELNDIREKWKPGSAAPNNGQQILLYFPAKPPESASHISKSELDDILKFIVLDVYPDSYDTDPEVWKEYCKYAEALYQKQKSTIPDPVHVTLAVQGPEFVPSFPASISERKKPLSGSTG